MTVRPAAAAAAAAALLAACTPAPETVVAAAPTPTETATAPATVTATATATGTATVTATAAATEPPPAQTTAPAAATAQIANGRAAYARTCAMCHGPTGAGTAMGVAITLKDPAAIAEKIAKGGEKMPPMAAMLSAAEIADIATFVAAGLPE